MRGKKGETTPRAAECREMRMDGQDGGITHTFFESGKLSKSIEQTCNILRSVTCSLEFVFGGRIGDIIPEDSRISLTHIFVDRLIFEK